MESSLKLNINIIQYLNQKMIRSSLVYPELGLVRVSNCPLRTKDYIRQARYRRDMQAFNWQLYETVKNIRKYKHKQYMFLRTFKRLMDKFHIYDPYIGDLILSQLKDTPIRKYYMITLKEPNYHFKIQTILGNLKRIGYTDVQLLPLTDFEIEMSFVKSVRYISHEVYKLSYDMYEVLTRRNIKYKWKIISSHIKHLLPNSTMEDCDFINLLYKYKKNELYLGYCLRKFNLSIEENNLMISWWERIKYSDRNE